MHVFYVKQESFPTGTCAAIVHGKERSAVASLAAKMQLAYVHGGTLSFLQELQARSHFQAPPTCCHINACKREGALLMIAQRSSSETILSH